MASEKAVTQIRVDAVLYEKIKLIAEKELRSMNNQIEYLLLQAVAAYERAEGMLEISPVND